MQFKFWVLGMIDVGMVWKYNEDCYEIDCDYWFFIVVDGMGGYSYGEVVFWIVVDSI